MSKRFAQFIAAAILSLGSISRSDAAVVFTANESGSDVVITGSGTLNVAAWGVSAGGFNTDNLFPNLAAIVMGTAGIELAKLKRPPARVEMAV